ncbi:MAG: hypothetical protein VW373_09860, partial [Halieaceae bacterium]
LDPVYTGKAFYGLITELKKGEYQDVEDIIFVHTGGVFGVFPHEQGLREALSHAGKDTPAKRAIDVERNQL